MNRRIRSLLAIIIFLLLVTSFISLSLAQEVTATIPVGNGPYSVIANPISHEVYVANIWADEVSIIDSLTDSLTATVKVGPPYPGGLSAPVALAYNPNTDKLYVVNFWSTQLMVIDLPSYQVEATISVGYSHTSPRAVVINPNTNLVYVTNLGQRLVYVIDGETTSSTYNQVIATIPVGSYPRSAAVNTTFNKLYVVNSGSNNVSVIDIDPASPTYHQVIANIPVGSQPYAIAINPATAKVYVTNRGSNNVSVIDGTTDSLTATVPVGATPRALDINPERNLIYVANQDSNNITVIDGSRDTVTSTIAAGIKPYAVACIKTTTGNTYVTNHGTGTTSTVTVIEPNFSTTEVPVGIYPASLSIDTLLPKPKVYVGNYGSDDVSVIDPEVGSSSLVTEIDPLPDDSTSITTPTFTGTSTSLLTPYPSKIMKVYYLIDSLNARWKEAEITEGKGTSSVKWKIEIPEPLSLGMHTIYVVALDMNGATVFSTNGNVSNTFCTGKTASYAFKIVPEIRKIFVEDIRLFKSVSNKREELHIEILVKDEKGNPVEGVSVEGILYAPRKNLISYTGLTNEEGRASFIYSPKGKRLKKGVYLFLIKSLEKEGFEYDTSLNRETYDYWLELPGKAKLHCEKKFLQKIDLILRLLEKI